MGQTRDHSAIAVVERKEVPRWTVPKRDLLSGIQVLLERGELRIAKDMPEWERQFGYAAFARTMRI